MSVVAEFSVPVDSFALHEALAAHTEVTVEAERLASHSPEWALPFLWTTGGDLESFTETMREDPTVESVSCIEETEDERLHRVVWTEDVLDLITEMIDRNGIILEAEARRDRWRLKLRFGDDGEVSRFREHFAERGKTFTVERLYHPSAPRQREFGLTSQQRETLVTASRRGYFEVPRRLSMAELATELGVSSNAVSQRIRRGTDNLVRNTLTIGMDDSE